MSKRHEVIDDDGNIIQPPPPDDPVTKVIYLLEYARKRGFQIGPTLQIGDVIVQVRDLRLKEKNQPRGPEIEPGSDMDVLLNG